MSRLISQQGSISSVCEQISENESLDDFENYVKCKKEPSAGLKIITKKEPESGTSKINSSNKLARKVTSRSVDSPSPIKCPISDSELEDHCPNSPLKSPNPLEFRLGLKK